MELSKKLANRYYSSLDNYHLSQLLAQTPEEAKKLSQLRTLIDSTLVSCFDLFVGDVNFLRLFEKYSRAFQYVNAFYISLYDLGITKEPGEYYDETGNRRTRIASHFSVRVSKPFPCSASYSFDLTKEYLEKMPEPKLELLKSLISEVIHLEWTIQDRTNSLKDLYDSGKIKTFGQLYRINPSWYELIVKSNYSDEVLVDEKEAVSLEEKAKDDFIKSLEELKPILDL